MWVYSIVYTILFFTQKTLKSPLFRLLNLKSTFSPFLFYSIT
eukprot:UN02476